MMVFHRVSRPVGAPGPVTRALAVLGLAAAFSAAGCRPPPVVQGTGGAGSGGSGSGGRSAGSGGATGSGGGGSGGMSTGSGGAASGGAGGSGGVSGSGGSGSGGVSSEGGVDTLDGGSDDGRPACQTARGPAPKQSGVTFPFPQNRESSRCVYPKSYCNSDVQAAYEQWKADTVTADGAPAGRRVRRTNEPGQLEKSSTVSEGIGYGMLIAVYMNDQSLFDDLWKYEQKFVDGRTGLMNWYIKADGSGPADGGGGPATDADEDMAFALLMADKQWGGSGSLGKSYLDIAKDTIGKIYANEIFDYKYLKPGAWGDNSATNLSYFAPAYYRLFAKVDTANASNWMMVIDTMYGVLQASLNSSNGNQANGLVPAWCDASGKPNGGAFGSTGPAPTNYQYDSCRTPFRIGLDWCWNGNSNALAYVKLTSNFFSGIGASKIVDGYDLNGTEHAQEQMGDNASIQSAAFVGPAAVGAMNDTKYQTFVDEAYSVVATRKLMVGGVYYEDSWTVMSMLMMTGNFLDYTTY
jgi:endo-1,4-beta-D-glucanase Y